MVGGKAQLLLSHAITSWPISGLQISAERGALQILFEMRNRFHSNQRGGKRQGLRERYRAPGIAVEPGESGANLVRERLCELGLHESGAANHCHVDAVRRLQQRDAVSAYALGRNAHRLRHGEVDRELDDLEVVVLAPRLPSNGYELFEA
jgi:hypothetical protein